MARRETVVNTFSFREEKKKKNKTLKKKKEKSKCVILNSFKIYLFPG